MLEGKPAGKDVRRGNQGEKMLEGETSGKRC